MNLVANLSLVALATTGLALIHETRLRRAADTLLRRLIWFLRQQSKGDDPK